MKYIVSGFYVLEERESDMTHTIELFKEPLKIRECLSENGTEMTVMRINQRIQT